MRGRQELPRILQGPYKRRPTISCRTIVQTLLPRGQGPGAAWCKVRISLPNTEQQALVVSTWLTCSFSHFFSTNLQSPSCSPCSSSILDSDLYSLRMTNWSTRSDRHYSFAIYTRFAARALPNVSKKSCGSSMALHGGGQAHHRPICGSEMKICSYTHALLKTSVIDC